MIWNYVKLQPFSVPWTSTGSWMWEILITYSSATNFMKQ